MTKIICELPHSKKRQSACVLTIGNFDGVHRGHQAILHALQDHAQRLNLASGVILFEPHPQEFFLGEKAPARLMRLREKIKILQDFSIDRIFCIHFNKRLAELEAKSFVKEILVERLNMRMLIIGDDFRFGKAREGDFNCLKKLGQRYQFQVYATPTVLCSFERIGSSRIRHALSQGDFKFAAKLLTRSFTLSGRVMQGAQRGRLLGFPTANIALHRLVSPLKGVFIVRVHGLEKNALNGVANCGQRPTVNGSKNLLEVHLFDFHQNIYGKFLTIEFLEKIRDEKKFDSLDLLKAAICKDVAITKAYFSSEKK